MTPGIIEPMRTHARASCAVVRWPKYGIRYQCMGRPPLVRLPSPWALIRPGYGHQRGWSALYGEAGFPGFGGTVLPVLLAGGGRVAGDFLRIVAYGYCLVSVRMQL